jgi:RNA polymerase sigma-70 factor (ECF subfamily)
LQPRFFCRAGSWENAQMQPYNCVLTAWNAHEEQLRAYLVRRMRDPYAADDLLQEVFLKSLRPGKGFCDLGNPRAWLFEVARNALLDLARAIKNIVELPDDLAAPDESERAPVEDLAAFLQRSLAELAPTDCEVLVQCDLKGVRQAVYAKAHDLSLAATRSRLLRARQRLRESLSCDCQVRFDEMGRVCCHVQRDPPC